MAESLPLVVCFPKKNEDDEKKDIEFYQKFTATICALPVFHRLPGSPLHQYKGFWFTSELGLKGIMAAQEHFTSLPSDVLLATLPKVGTTWLKALAFAIANRDDDAPFPISALLSHSPHECVPFIELQLYDGKRIPTLEDLPSPRLLATHMPYSILPESVLDPATSGKIVYLARNPRDTFISRWQFVNNVDPFLVSKLDKSLECFLSGLHWGCPFWDHVKGYWEASLANPEKVLFMRYEELIGNPATEVEKLARFMGRPFTDKEIEEGVVERIVEMCSMKNLSNLNVNKEGVTDIAQRGFNNKFFFRKGVVGDWVNYLTPEMAARIDRVVEEKLKGSGLSFEGCYESSEMGA